MNSPKFMLIKFHLITIVFMNHHKTLGMKKNLMSFSIQPQSEKVCATWCIRYMQAIE